MATGAITPPPGYSLEQPQAPGGVTPPPGYTLEQGTDAPTSQEQPGFLGNVWSGVKKAGSDVYNTVAGIAPPSNTNAASSIPGKALGLAEDVASGINNLTGITTVTNSLKSAGTMLDAYEKARASGGSIMDALHAANEQGRKQDEITPLVKERVADFQKNPTAETVRALGDVVATAAAIYGAHKIMGGTPTEAPEATPPETASTAEKPSIIQEIKQGKDVSQSGTQAAVRKGVQASTGETVGAEEPILKGDTTVVDKALDNIAQQKAAAYKQIDDTAGFDLKAEKAQLKNDLYEVKQPGNIDKVADIQERIDQSTTRIAEAETKLKAASVDPKAGDVLNTQWKAGQEFRKLLVRSSDAEGNVNVDKLLNGSKNLRLVSKYGDRLAQFMNGPENADAFMGELQKMQEMGAHALKTQRVVKMLAPYVAGAAATGIGTAAYEMLK